MAVKADVERFYETAEKAFTKAPNPYQRFASTHYAECLQRLCAGLGGEDGLALLVGGPGVGKTTLSEEVGAWWLRHRGLVGKVTNTQVGADDFQRLVAYAFDINPRGSGSSVQIKLEKLLRRHKARRKPPLLIVDEAQDLNPEAIEALRLLSNLSSDYQPLLHILLVAQDVFLERLGKQSLESLRQRLRVIVQLGPLDVQQTREYIAHQLRAANWQGQPRLSGAALRVVYQFTQGVPRWINVSMRYLLSLGAIERLTNLDVSEVVRVVAELERQRLSPANMSRARRREPETLDHSVPDLDTQYLQTEDKPPDSGSKLAWARPILDGLARLGSFGRLEYRGDPVDRNRARSRAVAGHTAGRNWALGAGLAVALVSGVGVWLHRATAPPVETPENSTPTAGTWLAPLTIETLLSSGWPRVLMPMGPVAEATGTLGLAEDIPGLNATIALPEAQRAFAHPSIADSLLAIAIGSTNGMWVDSKMGTANGLTALRRTPTGRSGSESVLVDRGGAEIETTLQELVIGEEGEREHLAMDVAALPPTKAGRLDRSASEAALDAAPSARVAKLLQAATTAIAEDRLTLPPKNNAYVYYQAVLAEDPNSARARAGLAKIVARYRTLAKNKLAAGELAEAQRLVNRGLKVAADDRPLLALKADIAHRRTLAANRPKATGEAELKAIVDFFKRATQASKPSTEEPDPTAHHPFEF